MKDLKKEKTLTIQSSLPKYCLFLHTDLRIAAYHSFFFSYSVYSPFSIICALWITGGGICFR